MTTQWPCLPISSELGPISLSFLCGSGDCHRIRIHEYQWVTRGRFSWEFGDRSALELERWERFASRSLPGFLLFIGFGPPLPIFHLWRSSGFLCALAPALPIVWVIGWVSWRRGWRSIAVTWVTVSITGVAVATTTIPTTIVGTAS